MFKKFFSKKNDGFYMQVDESAPPKAAVAPKETAAKSEVEAVRVTKESTSEPAVLTPEAVTTGVATVEQRDDKKTKSAKTSIKKDKKQEKKEAVTPEASTAAPAAPAFTNFATDYLITPAAADSRRRPGANMKSFMSMARDVKEMKKGSQGNQQQREKAAKKVEA